MKGVCDLNPVPLNADNLDKEIIADIESLANQFNLTKSTLSIKKAKVQGVPVLKPMHVVYCLTGQVFRLGQELVGVSARCQV